MAISFVEAYSVLGTDAYKTVDSLVNLAKSISGTVLNAASGSTFLLYSGEMLDRTTFASESAAAIVSQNSTEIFSVTQSEANKFIL